MKTAVMEMAAYGLPALSVLSEGNPLSEIAVIAAAADGYFTAPSGLKNMYNSTLIVSKTADVETQSRLEFDLSSLPPQSYILRATFEFHIQAMQLACGETSMALICGGFVGTGSLSIAHPHRVLPIGVLTLTGGHSLGLASLALNVDFVQQTLACGRLGLCLRLSAPLASTRANMLLLRSLENANASLRPTLCLEYMSAEALVFKDADCA